MKHYHYVQLLTLIQLSWETYVVNGIIEKKSWKDKKLNHQSFTYLCAKSLNFLRKIKISFKVNGRDFLVEKQQVMKSQHVDFQFKRTVNWDHDLSKPPRSLL